MLPQQRRGEHDDHDSHSDDVISDTTDRKKNPWPAVVVFIALLVFTFKMTELFAR